MQHYLLNEVYLSHKCLYTSHCLWNISSGSVSLFNHCCIFCVVYFWYPESFGHDFESKKFEMKKLRFWHKYTLHYSSGQKLRQTFGAMIKIQHSKVKSIDEVAISSTMLCIVCGSNSPFKWQIKQFVQLWFVKL